MVGVYFDKAERNAEAIKLMKTIPEILNVTIQQVIECANKIMKDNEHLMLILNKKIQSIKGVSRTETFISLEQIDRQLLLIILDLTKVYYD